MKAIILTYAPVTDSDKVLLQSTKIFKVAINQHGEEYKPDVRVAGDWNLTYLCKNFSQPIVSLREHFRFISPREVENNVEYKGATIVGAVEWLIQRGIRDILIVGDNTVNTKEFQDNINKYITPLMTKTRIWQYSYGNFNVPVKSIEKFIEEDMKEKYVVGNCPCLQRDNVCTENSLVRKKCQEYNSCLIKEVINTCRKSLDKSYCGTECNILNLFDVEEYEDEVFD